MTVAQLIERLKTMPEDMDVFGTDEYGGDYPMNNVERYDCKAYQKYVVMISYVNPYKVEAK